jgi:hypothetical protein
VGGPGAASIRLQEFCVSYGIRIFLANITALSLSGNHTVMAHFIYFFSREAREGNGGHMTDFGSKEINERMRWKNGVNPSTELQPSPEEDKLTELLQRILQLQQSLDGKLRRLR